MANTINTMQDAPGVIAKLAATMLADTTQFCQSIDKADNSDFNGKNGYQAGDTIQISKPARFVPSTGADITSAIQDVTEEKTSLTLDTRSVVPIALTSGEIATDLALEQWSKRVLKPAVSSIAQDIESRFIEKATDATFQSVGTAGSTVFNTDTILASKEKLSRSLVPLDENRTILLDSAAERSAVVARNGLFQSASEISEQYKKGVMGIADGYTYKSNELLNVHTNGNDVAGVLVAGASQTGATLGVDGLTTTTGTVTKGSVFTLAGVYAVHPITKQTTDQLQQFVVTADVTADGSGAATVAISPSIIVSGSTQTVSGSPADNAAITFVGAADSALTQNLAFHKSAFRMVSVPLVTPDGMDMAAQETVDGMTIRVLRQYDILTDKLVLRLDFLGGLASVRPEWACRVTA